MIKHTLNLPRTTVTTTISYSSMMAESSEQQNVDHLKWEWYQALPPTLKSDIEAVELKALISKHSSEFKKELSVDECASALSASPRLREELLSGWQSGSYEAFYHSESFLSLFEPAEDDLGGIDEGDEGVKSKNFFIRNSNLLSVAGDLWQISYSSDAHIEIANWFSTEDQRLIHNEISAKRMEDTGEGILKSRVFRNWLTDPKSRVLWCPGIPGAGKTVTRRWDNQSLESVLWSMARQVYECTEGLPLKTLYAAHYRNKSRPTIVQVKQAIKSSVESHNTCYLVLDALDEYSKEYNPKKIRDLFDQLLSLGSNVKILVTSRRIGDMGEVFEKMGADEIEVMATEDDIAKYVSQRLTAFDFDFPLSEDLRDQIIHSVKGAAEGSFLVAELHMHAIESQPTLGDLKDALSTLPRDLDAIYEQAMGRIQAQSQPRRNMAMKILMWTTFSQRPLRIVDLQEILALRPGIPATSLKDYRPSVSMITSVCAGLFSIEIRSSLSKDRFLIFVHFSTKTFFDYHREHYFPNANGQLLRTCWDYLCLEHSHEEIEDLFRHSAAEFSADIRYLYPFYEYACLHWGLYADETLPLEDVVRFLLDNDDANWMCLVYILNLAPGCSNLSAFDRVFKNIASPSLGFDFLNDSKGTGVFLALYHAKYQALPLLVNSASLEQDLTTIRGRTPLTFAAMHGMTQVIRCMVNAPASENSMAEFPPEVVSILQDLARPGDREKADHFGRTALSYAAEGGHAPTVQLLLELTAIDVNCEDLCGRTALSYAAQGGHDKVIDLLLRHQAEVNSKDTQRGFTALMYAAEHVQFGASIINLLLEYGGSQIDINVKDKEGRTALYYAIICNNEGAAKVLLEDERVEIEWPDDRKGNLEIELLIDHGGNPLIEAAKRGLDTVVTTLLKRGDIDLNSTDKNGYTALMRTAQTGSISTVYLLLQQPSVSIESRNRWGDSVVSIAAAFVVSKNYYHWEHCVDGGTRMVPRRKSEAALEEWVALQMLGVILASRENVDFSMVDKDGKTLCQRLSTWEKRRYIVEDLLCALEGTSDQMEHIRIFEEIMTQNFG